jgi:GlpG protein
VNTLLIWLVVCMTGMIGPVANAAHFVGLVVGVVAGLMGF